MHHPLLPADGYQKLVEDDAALSPVLPLSFNNPVVSHVHPAAVPDDLLDFLLLLQPGLHPLLQLLALNEYWLYKRVESGQPVTWEQYFTNEELFGNRVKCKYYLI